MTIDELHDLLTESEPPFTIQTKGGRSYQITNRANIWIPEAYKDIICLVPDRMGIIFVRLNAIESVHTEHETAGMHRSHLS